MFDEITVLRETNFFFLTKNGSVASLLHCWLMLFDHWRIQIVLGRQLMDKVYPPRTLHLMHMWGRKKCMLVSSSWGSPCCSARKESICNVGELGSIPGLGQSPGEGKGYPLQYSRLENSMDCIVHGVAKTQTRLSHFHFSSSVEAIF